MRCIGHVAHMGEMRNAYKIVILKPEGKRQLGRPGHRFQDDIRMDIMKIVCGILNSIHLYRDRDQWDPSNSIKDGEFIDLLSDC